jgi:hypothetical protein
MPSLGLGGSGIVGGGGGVIAPSGPTLPSELAILPEQQWADNIQSLDGWGQLDKGALGITYFDPDYIEHSVRKQFSMSFDPILIDLHDNSLTTANVEDIFSQVYNVANSLTINAGTLLLGGSTMGVVTPQVAAVARVNGTITLDFTAVNIATILTHDKKSQKVTYSGGEGTFDFNDGVTIATFTVTFNPGLFFFQSTAVSPDIVIGTSDAPTAADIVTFVMDAFAQAGPIVPPWPGAYGRVADTIVMEGETQQIFFNLTGDFVETQAFAANDPQFVGSIARVVALPISIYFDPSLSVGGSTYNNPPGGDGNIYLGAKDIVSNPADYLNALAGIINQVLGPWDSYVSASVSGFILTLTYLQDADYPINASWVDGEVGVVATVTNAGTPAAETWNATVLALQALGWTGTFNDPVGGPITAF